MQYLLDRLLEESSARHSHLCPRQVLGVRMGLAGLRLLGIERPVSRQTALIFIESDGCFADGIGVATGATIGHRTLRVEDLGKIAATFADVKTGHAIRLAPHGDARIRALLYAPAEHRRYFAQLQGYQLMPARELFRIQEVTLAPSISEVLSKPGARAVCERCGEEIMNERQVCVAGAVLCRTCARGSYYEPLNDPLPLRHTFPESYHRQSASRKPADRTPADLAPEMN